MKLQNSRAKEKTLKATRRKKLQRNYNLTDSSLLDNDKSLPRAKQYWRSAKEKWQSI